MVEKAILFIAMFGLGLVNVQGQCAGGITLSNYYSNGMVMQADQKVHVWGFTNDDGCEVTVEAGCTDSFQTVSTSTFKGSMSADSSIWELDLNPLGSSGDQCTLAFIQGEQRIQLEVWVGDVWICSGQSNMERKMSSIFNSTEEIADGSKYTNIKMFNVEHSTADVEMDDVLLAWDSWYGAEDVPKLTEFSAICFLTAKYLSDTLGENRVFGLISTNWGGTRVEPWMSRPAWESCGLEYFENPDKPQNTYSSLWNAMLYPFLKHTIKGALWYQGESNVGYNRDLYDCTFPAMINDWRQRFNQASGTDEKFPFGFVQLASHIGQNGPIIRWKQTKNYGYVPNPDMEKTFMAVALDTHDEEGGIHPRNKQLVSKRMSYSALNVAYNEDAFPANGPFPDSVVTNGNVATITYDQDFTFNANAENSGFYTCCEATLEECTATGWLWALVPKENVVAQTGERKVEVDFSASLCDSSIPSGLAYLWENIPLLITEGAPIYSSDQFKMPSAPWQKQL